MTLSKVLIANRGEIAVRIITACKDLGIQTVAVFSEADRDALHVRLADEAVCIGPSPSAQSYLNIPNIISAAEITEAEAIHPGYGFLAENPDFAEICESCQIKFIGPPSHVIQMMGDKAMARSIAKKAGVPVVPGSEKSVTSLEEASEIAEHIGYPVLLKAAAGGGGRGMRIVYRKSDLPRYFESAKQEAEKAFGRGDLYVEKYLIEPRHIEVQILADEHGNVLHLFERECSIQRRHQKVIEEAPSPVLTPALRKKICQSAVELAKAVGYMSAGTVEFLLDKNKNYYFIEMNTRIQVEHPVTEWITGVDIVAEQIRIASGEPLRFKQKDLKIRGHAIECRINAEHPESFFPSAGTIEQCIIPTMYGVRWDSAVYAGYSVPPFYDSLIGKLTAWGRTREEALDRMVRALQTTIISGIFTNIELHKAILENPFFRKGRIHTQFLEEFLRARRMKQVSLSAS